MRELTDKQRRALNEYGVLRITLDQMRDALGDAIQVHFGSNERKVFFHYDNRNPVVHVELQHIKEVMDRHAQGDVTTEELSDWAAMLLANPSYDWEGPDEDEIADWLNEISLLCLKSKPSNEQG